MGSNTRNETPSLRDGNLASGVAVSQCSQHCSVDGHQPGQRKRLKHIDSERGCAMDGIQELGVSCQMQKSNHPLVKGSVPLAQANLCRKGQSVNHSCLVGNVALSLSLHSSVLAGTRVATSPYERGCVKQKSHGGIHTRS